MTAHSKSKAKTRHLTFLLIRKEFRSPEDALKHAEQLDKWPLPSDYEFEGCRYIVKPPLKEPRWASFVKEAFEGVEFVQSATAAAVLFVKSDSRLFAVTFGQGRHQIKPDAFEIDFGLKVTLNTVVKKPTTSGSRDHSSTSHSSTEGTRRRRGRGQPSSPAICSRGAGSSSM